jgi:hypothetical protein
MARERKYIPLFDNIAQHPHHSHCLLLREAFLFQSLHELKRIEMVIFSLHRRCAKVPPKT